MQMNHFIYILYALTLTFICSLSSINANIYLLNINREETCES